VDEQRLAAVLAEFAQTLVRRFSIQDILDHFVEQVAEVLHVTGAGVVLIGPDRELHFVATTDSRSAPSRTCRSSSVKGRA
jgi:uncharacterized protein YigA (DUF484 family)